MKSLSKVAVLGSALITSSSAIALDMPDMSGFYYHVQYSMLNVDISNQDGSGSASSPALSFEIGTSVYNHEIAKIYLEAVAMLGLDDETAFNNGTNRYRGGINAAIGVQAKALRQFDEKFAGFFNLGIMNITTSVVSEACSLSICSPNASIPDDTKTGLTFALGGEYMLNESATLTLSYSSLYSDTVGNSDVDITSINLGYKARF